MSYSSGQSSTPYVVLAGSITIVLIGVLWGVLDTTLLGELMASSQWMSGSPQAQLMQTYVLQAWTWFPLIILLRLGLEFLIRAREVSGVSTLIAGSFGLLFMHMILIIWAFALPAMLDPLFSLGLNSPAVASSGYDTSIRLMRDLAFVFVPGLFAVSADLWYLTSPIRNDSITGYY